MNEWKQNNLGNTDTVHVYCIQYLITILMICLTPSILNRAYALILYTGLIKFHLNLMSHLMNPPPPNPTNEVLKLYKKSDIV